jgi:endonuclease YncB( thermonuclease family)
MEQEQETLHGVSEIGWAADDIVAAMTSTASLLRRRLLQALSAIALAALCACQPPDAGTSLPGSPPGGAVAPRPDSSALDAMLAARTVRVQDGDSFIATTDDGKRITVRLSGVDAPERSQAFADRARRHLRGLLEKQSLRIRVAKTDRFGRIVGEVYVVHPDGGASDAGLAQIAAGLAWYFRRYADDLPAALRDRYAQAEARARESRAGLWGDPEPEPPWEFRRRGPGR